MCAMMPGAFLSAAVELTGHLARFFSERLTSLALAYHQA
jgi:hypothetical protein